MIDDFILPRFDSFPAWQFTEESKAQVFNNITCNKYPDWEGDNPVIVLQTPKGEKVVRFGDWVIKTGEGEFWAISDDMMQAFPISLKNSRK
jgi:hypothetical protein